MGWKIYRTWSNANKYYIYNAGLGAYLKKGPSSRDGYFTYDIEFFDDLANAASTLVDYLYFADELFRFVKFKRATEPKWYKVILNGKEIGEVFRKRYLRSENGEPLKIKWWKKWEPRRNFNREIYLHNAFSTRKDAVNELIMNYYAEAHMFNFFKDVLWEIVKGIGN